MTEYFIHVPATFRVTLLGLVAPMITIRSIHDWVVKWASGARLLKFKQIISNYITLQIIFLKNITLDSCTTEPVSRPVLAQVRLSCEGIQFWCDLKQGYFMFVLV